MIGWSVNQGSIIECVVLTAELLACRMSGVDTITWTHHIIGVLDFSIGVKTTWCFKDEGLLVFHKILSPFKAKRASYRQPKHSTQSNTHSYHTRLVSSEGCNGVPQRDDVIKFIFYCHGISILNFDRTSINQREISRHLVKIQLQ